MTDTIKISRDCPLCDGTVQFHRDEECSGCHLLCCQRCLTTFDLSLGVDANNECATLYDLQLRIADAWNRRATPPADAADMGGQAGEEVEVVAWLSEVRSGNKTVIRASLSETSLEGMRKGYRDENAVIVRDDPCMTVAQHQRIVAALSAQQSKPSTVTRDQIRAVFLRNGFTIKEGQTDLKPYVYAAAEELLSIAGASWQRTQSAPVSQAERHQLESLEFVKRPVPSGWAVKRSDASRHEFYQFYDEYLGPLDGWLQDPRRAVLFGNKEAAIAAQAALSVDSKLAISVVWLVYDPVFDTYREQAQ